MALRDRLANAAMQNIDQGATLGADVQAEFLRAGLEKAGMVTGAATPRGIGGTIIRQELGTRALALQQQRQQSAAALAASASALEGQRQQILGSLYPNLNSMKLQNLGATQSVLNQSNQMVPEAGLGGTDIANLWLARVGAVNQLNQSAADVAARGTMAAGQAWGQGLGAASGYLANALPSAANTYNTVSGWFSQPQAASGGNLSDALAYA